MTNEFAKDAFLLVSDYVKPNTGEDVSDALQELILNNPKRVLFFPDGEYIISRPLQTTSEPAQSTSFYFSSGAVLKAADDWKKEDMKNALINFYNAIEVTLPNDSFYYEK